LCHLLSASALRPSFKYCFLRGDLLISYTRSILLSISSPSISFRWRHLFSWTTFSLRAHRAEILRAHFYGGMLVTSDSRTTYIAATVWFPPGRWYARAARDLVLIIFCYVAGWAGWRMGAPVPAPLFKGRHCLCRLFHSLSHRAGIAGCLRHLPPAGAAFFFRLLFLACRGGTCYDGPWRWDRRGGRLSLVKRRDPCGAARALRSGVPAPLPPAAPAGALPSTCPPVAKGAFSAMPAAAMAGQAAERRRPRLAGAAAATACGQARRASSALAT